MNPTDGTQMPGSPEIDGLDGAYAPIDPAKVAAATRYIRTHADAADAGMLLTMLGIGGRP